MTREQKLALIAAFTVVLLFGVLLADHLSRARAEPLLAADEQDGPLVIPRIESRPLAGASGLPLVPRRDLAQTNGGFAAADPFALAEPMPTSARAGPSEILRESTQRSGGVAPASPRIDVRSIFADRNALSADSAADEYGLVEPSAGSNTEIRRDIAAIPREPSRANDGNTASLLPGFVRVVPKETSSRARAHTVKSGETLYAICEKYYGDGHIWRDLARHNRSVVPADGRVAVGARLVIPTRAALGGAPVAEAATTAIPVRPTPGVEGVYVVRDGDTLSEISEQLMGSVRFMDDLIAMNRDKIRDADDIRVGMKLRYRPGPAA